MSAPIHPPKSTAPSADEHAAAAAANRKTKVLLLHGLHGSPEGTKAQFLRRQGFTVIAPALSTDNFAADIGIAQKAFDEHRPDVVVGSSRGGAVAVNINVGDTPLILVAPAWKRWGTATKTTAAAVILHSERDDLIPLDHSRELVKNTSLQADRLITVGDDHSLNDDRALLVLAETIVRVTSPAVGDELTGSAPLIRPPLALPRGSVRALLALMIVAVVVTEVVRGNVVPLLWTETLMIALAHYFTSRRFIQLPPAVVKQLEADGHLDNETNPLHLPRHTIRIVIFFAFVGLAVYLYRNNRLFRADSLVLLATVFAYFVGVLLRPVFDWWSRRATESAQSWEHVKAATVLLSMAVLAALYLTGNAALVPPFAKNATLALVLFYFGSR